MLYIIPGFIFIRIFNYFTASKSNGLFLWVESAAISFVSLSALQILFHEGLSEWLLCILSCLLCAVSSLGSAAIERSQWFKDSCGKYFRITNAPSVLSDAVNWQKGTAAVVRLKSTQEIYAGWVRTISRPDDQAQWICIDWPTKFDNDYNVLWPQNKESTKDECIAIRLDEVDVIRFI